MTADTDSGASSLEESPSSADPETVEDLLEDLDELLEGTTSEDAVESIQEAKVALLAAHQEGLLESKRRILDARDAAEAFVGSVIFASPLLVEDGVFEIGEYLFTFSISGVPVFLLLNTLFVVFMTYALVEWTGRITEDSHALFGMPVRVLMILLISLLVAALLMVVWGRVDLANEPTEALARINVIWTVGSLGAALGDIISEGDPGAPAKPAVTAALGAPETANRGIELPERTDFETDGELIEEIYDRFDTLQESIDRDVTHIRDRTIEAAIDDLVGEQIQKYTSRDIAEAFVGSVFFSIPFLVEDGVFEVASYFLSFQIGRFPVYFLVNAAFVVGMISLLVYWAGPKDVTVTRPILGFIPRRLVGIAVVSFLTAAALMTMWGRVDNWADPVDAVARISVVWTVASFGAALGDILPGESSGDDINDDLADLGEQVEDLL
jgi:uncharacterized membrane protein